MENNNIFNKCFDQLDQSHQVNEQIRTKISESMKELTDIKRLTSSKQSECSVLESKVIELKMVNQRIQESLVGSLMEKDELFTKKKDLSKQIEQIQQQLKNLDSEANLMLNDESIEQICQRYSTSNQLSLLNKIHEAKCKLLKFQK